MGPAPDEDRRQPVPFATIARQWLRLGILGFGGPPAHIAMLRRLCVTRTGWLEAGDLETGIAAANLLPGPASTQLAMWCAWRLRRSAGAIIAGLCFIVPGLVVILALSVLFLASHPPLAVAGAAAGAGAVVPAVALRAAADLLGPSWQRTHTGRPARARWVLYVAAGALAGATAGAFLVLVLLACGLIELAPYLATRRPGGHMGMVVPIVGPAVVAAAGLGALVWVAFSVGALSYGGGFVIIPLMQSAAVNHYHWMTSSQFLDAVALGQITPGPVVQTVAVIGYAADGVGGGLLASAVAFAPSFAFVLVGAPHFDRLRNSKGASIFLAGAGPAALGAIAGVGVPLGRALTHLWQVGILGAALVLLLVLMRRRAPTVPVLIGGGILGMALALGGFPVGH